MTERRGHGTYANGYLSCPTCNSGGVSTTEEEMSFTWGDGETFPQVTLKATVPVRCCENCGYQWTDGEAEDKITRAQFIHEQGVAGIVRTKFASTHEKVIWEQVADELSDPTGGPLKI